VTFGVPGGLFPHGPVLMLVSGLRGGGQPNREWADAPTAAQRSNTDRILHFEFYEFYSLPSCPGIPAG
jgi:hypothetical protein